MIGRTENNYGLSFTTAIGDRVTQDSSREVSLEIGVFWRRPNFVT
tara:strand:- start:2965 stop:3099 length:135 start_codon:yes stop_codon:yes gene_type:complete